MKTHLLLMILIPMVSFSQINKGKITYHVEMEKLQNEIDKEKSTISDYKYQFLSKTFEASKSLKFTLVFEKNLSIYQNVESLSIGDSDSYKDLALIMSQNKGRYYTNLESNEQLIETRDGIFIESDIQKSNWKFTNETKKIGKFTCYKATLVKTVPAKDVTIIAWYSPDFPMSFGPKEWSGQLPGLILELHDLTMSYYASEIDLKSDLKTKVKWPENFSSISSDEYKRKGEKIFKSLKHN